MASRSKPAIAVATDLHNRSNCSMCRPCGKRLRPWVSVLPDATEVLFEIGSTNEFLHAATAPPPDAPRLVFAELQTAGRGRRGRDWLAPFGSGLTFSIGWTFAETPADLSALSLALGVCVVRALRDCGAPDVQLKWPNDIVHEHAKLGGLLLQMRSEAGGPAYVVAGLGLNLRMPATARAAHSRSIGDTRDRPRYGLLQAGCPHARRSPRVSLRACCAACTNFAQRASTSFAADWAAFDSLRDTQVTVLRHDGSFDGIARGADRAGALCVERPSGAVERVHAGDVSLRRNDAARGRIGMMLLVDVGNTRVKWATLAAGRLTPQLAATYAAWSTDDWHRELFAGSCIERVLAVTVAGPDTRNALVAAAALAGVTQVDFVAASAAQSGVRNAYPQPHLLGADRWVAAIGAYHLARGACCVVDIGTAATIDAVTADGRHLGGFIVPGPELMMSSLHAGTSNLAAHTAASLAGSPELFADNTRDAIERGCRVALAALVRSCLRRDDAPEWGRSPGDLHRRRCGLDSAVRTYRR